METVDFTKDVGDQLRDMTDGRGPDAVVDAVGMEAHDSPVGAFAQNAVGLLPDALARKAMETAGVDRMTSSTPPSTPCAGAGPSR